MQGLRELDQTGYQFAAWVSMYRESRAWVLSHMLFRGGKPYSFQYTHAAVQLLFDLGLLGEYGSFRSALASTEQDLGVSVISVMDLFNTTCSNKLKEHGWDVLKMAGAQGYDPEKDTVFDV